MRNDIGLIGFEAEVYGSTFLQHFAKIVLEPENGWGRGFRRRVISSSNSIEHLTLLNWGLP
jgi:hypothetical protein